MADSRAQFWENSVTATFPEFGRMGLADRSSGMVIGNGPTFRRHAMLKTIAFVSALVLAPAAIAAAPDAAPSRIVATSDLKLSTAAGRAQLDSRIGRAVEAVCGRPSAFQLARTRLIKNCSATAKAVASAQRAQVMARVGGITEIAAR